MLLEDVRFVQRSIKKWLPLRKNSKSQTPISREMPNPISKPPRGICVVGVGAFAQLICIQATEHNIDTAFPRNYQWLSRKCHFGAGPGGWSIEENALE
jgi:hypothetical protein